MTLILDLLRSSFLPRTGRSFYVVDDFFIKKYSDSRECEYEYMVLEGIAAANPTTFLVPKVFKVSVSSEDSFIIVELVKGDRLQDFITNFLLFRESEAIKTFEGLGRALRELHHMSLKGLRSCSFPNSLQKIKSEIFKSSRVLEVLNTLDHELGVRIRNAVGDITRVDNEIFTNVNLHGEFYFSHVLLSSGKYVFVDFHNSCRGPSYFDLAALSVSLYGSVTLPCFKPTQLMPLINAFLAGYYGRPLDNEAIKSVRLAELYVALKEILSCSGVLQSNLPLTNKFLAVLRARRLKKAVKESILPILFAELDDEENYRIK